ncbi:unnamed protein product [Tuber aestivum]|uniref:Uncharacterized protein n=1 Tax=Tuber aestivum TaxID=59557 RepID=A0A292Q8Q0_9PEZI|nr:unnamed protein product [Tuber aestivum]
MSPCGLGSRARVCAMGQSFRSFFFSFSLLAINSNSSPIESQFDSGIALARKIPTRGNHPSQTLRNVTSTTGRLSYP